MRRPGERVEIVPRASLAADLRFGRVERGPGAQGYCKVAHDDCGYPWSTVHESALRSIELVPLGVLRG